MPKGVTKRRPRTQQRLLDAALDAFAELGFQGASIEDICSRAGFTRGAFYSNFSSRDELFLALYDAQTQRVMAQYANALADPATGGQLTLEEIVRLAAHIDSTERKWYVVWSDYMLHAIRTPEAANALAGRNATLRRQVGDLIASSLKHAGLEPAIDCDEIASMFIVVREGALPRSIFDPEANPPGLLEERLLSLILNATTRPRGPVT